MTGIKVDAKTWTANAGGAVSFADDATALAHITQRKTDMAKGNMAIQYTKDGTTYEFANKADTASVAGASTIAAVGAALALATAF